MMSVIVCIALRQPNSDESFKNIILMIASCLIVMIWLVLVINLAGTGVIFCWFWHPNNHVGL
jgi:lipopolysaccharide export LptBFGC system permease protein LptF